MAVCEGVWCRNANPSFSSQIPEMKGRKSAENLPMGRASVASGYTPDAGAGKSRLSPRPPKGGVLRARVKTESKKESGFTLKKKTTIITARLTPSEKAAIQKRARKAKMTMTDYIVQCALGKEIVQVDGLGEILSELKAQGRNLNQLTTLANMGRIDVVQSEELITAYTDICSHIERITREVE